MTNIAMTFAATFALLGLIAADDLAPALHAE